MNNPHRIRRKVVSFLETISLSEFKNIQAVFDRSFTTRELNYLEDKTIQSKAGFFLLKKAVKKCLCSVLREKTEILERDIVLGNRKNGEPCIKKLPASLEGIRDRIKLSISHTRKNVYAVAAIERIND
jgi:phosphopantetheinyl transferase (holo-ACP synthase)